VDAEAHYREALRLRPDFADAHANLGVLLARQRRLDEAAEHFAAALRLAPRNARTHANFGILLAEQGKLTESKAHYHEALRLDPSFWEARAGLAWIERREREGNGKQGRP
jgi:tetratricopeptide (TPR) repeat protein